MVFSKFHQEDGVRTRVLAVLSAFAITAGSVQAADLRPNPPGPVAEAAAAAAAPSPAATSVGLLLPCLFDCAGYEQQVAPPTEPASPPQTAAAPGGEAVPAADAETAPEAVHHQRTQHAFAQARSPNREGRSISVAPKVSRPNRVRHTAVVVAPAYDSPLDASAMPSSWQLRAGPATAVRPAPAVKTGPWGTLRGF